jgi:iron complex transport system ATP-binding protein|nr:ABC transporter ATP-binding protein [uncultured Lachnoclostridium sp.]
MDKQQTIQVNELSWQPQKEEEAILKEICATFLQGGFYGILGPNGSGKTSFIRHILRLLPSDSGSIFLENKELTSYKRKDIAKKMSLVPQNTNIETRFTAYEIVMMGRTPYQKRFQAVSNKDRDIVSEAMKMTNCYNLREAIFSRLSGGEKQRVIIARAIAQQTPWLFLDEPIAHLDVRYQMELMKYLKKLNDSKNTSIITVLHDINLASRYCKQIVLMKNGRIVAAGTTKEVLTIENLNQVFEIPFCAIENETFGGSYFVPITS